MSNLGDLKIYLTNQKMVITNEQGLRMEFDIPSPGNIIVFHVGSQTFHIGLYGIDPPRSPTVSDLESDDSRSSTAPSGGGGPGDPIEI